MLRRRTTLRKFERAKRWNERDDMAGSRGCADTREESESEDGRSTTGTSTWTRGVVSTSGSSVSAGPQSLADSEMFQERAKLYDDIANKSLHPSETELMIRKFRRSEDIPFYRFYHAGRPVNDSVPEAAVPLIALSSYQVQICQKSIAWRAMIWLKSTPIRETLVGESTPPRPCSVSRF